MKKFESFFAHWVVNNRAIVLLLAFFVIAVPTVGVNKLYFDASYRVYFGEDNPQLMAFEAIEDMYTRNDNVLIVIAPDDGNVFTPSTLSAIEALTESSWQIPYSSRVDSITNFQFTSADGDDLIVRDMVKNADGLSDKELEDVRNAVLAEPALSRRLISQEGHVTGVNVTLQISVEDRPTATPVIVAHARKLAQSLEQQNPGLKTYLSGMVMMDTAFQESAIRDFSVLVPISFVLMMGLIAVLVGGVVGTLVTIGVILSSILAAMGASGHIGYPLTGDSSSAPIIILTVAVANCVHVLVTFVHEMRGGKIKKDAMEESIRVNLAPVFLASATTAIGFLSLNSSEVPPFAALGNIVAMGVLFSFFMTVTFLPAVVTLLPARVKERTSDNTSAMSRLGDFVIFRRRYLLWASFLIVGIAVSNISRNEINDIFYHYFGEGIDFRDDTDFIIDNLTGIYINNYSVDAGESGGISNPAFLRDVEKLSVWLESLPETIHVDRFTTVMKRLNKNMHGDEESYYSLPETRDLAAQYLLLYEMSLPFGLDVNNQINVDKSSTKISHTIQTISSEEAIKLDARIHKWIEENAPAIASAESGSTMLMFSNIGQRNVRSMLLGTSLALFAISGILILALRSLKIGLISLVPNLIPAAVGFGLWGIFVGEVGLSLSIVTGMSFGIVVDNTVHFLSKYLRSKRENGLAPQDAVRYAFRIVGRALVITTTTLVIGFSALATSKFSMNADMGLMTAIIITIALAGVFFLLPPLLLKIEDRDAGSAQATSTPA